jgi:RHS repeat-associated protein
MSPLAVAAGFNGIPTNEFGTESIGNRSNGAGADDAASSGIGPVTGSDSVGAGGQDTAGGLVFLHSGELIRRVTDLGIPGRGFDWKMDRTYRSGLDFSGPLGHNWEFSYNRRLALQQNGDVIRMDGYGRADRYVYTTKGFVAPPGYFTQLTQNQDRSYVERDRHGAKAQYSAALTEGGSRLTALRDRNDNRMQFEYNDLGQLSRVLDTMGRAILYSYEAASSLLSEVRDFTGRTIRFEYDAQGDLVAVTGPAVTGTPNGNDFPAGKTGKYTYSSGYPDSRLNHKMISVTAPNEVAIAGPPCIVARYDLDLLSPDVGRLTQLTCGGVNASGVTAGGTIQYQYNSLLHEAARLNTAIFQNTVTDRNGNTAQYQFNRLGNIIQVRRFPRGLRSHEPDYYQTQFQYNADGLLLFVTKPLSNTIALTYDFNSSDRFQQGNLLSIIKKPDPSRGGDQTSITTTMTHEPVYNHLLTFTSGRGNDPTYVPQNGGANSAARYTTVYTYDYQEGENYASLGVELGIPESAARTRLAAIPMNLGDVNGHHTTDRIHGDRVRTTRAPVTLLTGSNESVIEGSTRQPIVSLYTYNQGGQIISRTDPEGNVTEYSYYPEDNPNGDGQKFTPGVGGGPFGYLQQITIDITSNPIRDSRTNPTPASIVSGYKYDLVGNVTRRIDGRGIATDYFVNQLNQVVQVTGASAHNLLADAVAEPIDLVDFGYLSCFYFDANNNVVRAQIEDRGNTSGTGGFVDRLFSYDILNHRVQITNQVSANKTVVWQYRYDANGHRTLAIQPESNANASLYDERNLLFQTVLGTTMATTGTLSPPLVSSQRGGVPSTYTRNYDQNGNLVESVDAADKDNSDANNSTIAGIGDVTRISYDGFDRASSVTDAVGGQTNYNYDPAGNVVKSTRSGLTGGSSPTTNATGNNTTLSIVELSYDEINRVFQRGGHLFVSTGVNTIRPPQIADGPLTPGDGVVTTRYEYDRNSRPGYTIDDNGNTNQWNYDGVNRRIKALDPEKNLREWAYDGNGNRIEACSTDAPQKANLSKEVFLTTNFYDALNRRQRRVNNVGQSTEFRYDSRNNLVSVADADGPINSKITRRAFTGGALTVNDINGFGNVTLYSYDGLNRRLRSDRVMTASGNGDGIHNGASIFGIRTDPPPPDNRQAGGDGLITVQYQWDGNSLLTSLTDDNGNQTQRTYDNHNRLLTETKGVSVAPYLAGRVDPPTTVSYSYDADGNLTQGVDENGSVTTNQFDAVSRLISSHINRAVNVVGTTFLAFQYDGIGRLTSAADNNEPLDPSDDSTMTYAYDSLSRVIEETQKIGTIEALAIDSAWTGVNRTGLTYPDGRVLTKTFDHLNRLASVADTGTTSPLATYSYIGRSRVTERTYPINETTLTYLGDSGTNDIGYDGLRRPVELRHVSEKKTLVGFAHTYDRSNNPLSETKLHAPNDSELYDYDSQYRLLQFARGLLDGDSTSIQVPSALKPLQGDWTLDGVGNSTKVDHEARIYNSFNELFRRSNGETTTIISDKNGNETKTGNLVLQYDYRNRLRKVSRQSDAQPLAVYSYDAINRRIGKVVTNSSSLNGATRYYLDGWREIEERNGANNVTQQYVYGRYLDEPLVLDRFLNGDKSSVNLQQRLFYHENRQHSIFALSDVSGKVVEGYQYEAYGMRTVFEPGASEVVTFSSNDAVKVGGTSALGNPYAFAGRRFDPESGIYYYRNRYMAPDQGRFISRDPIGFGGGSVGLYEYVRSRPGCLLDPFGKGDCSQDVVEAVVDCSLAALDLGENPELNASCMYDVNSVLSDCEYTPPGNDGPAEPDSSDAGSSEPNSCEPSSSDSSSSDAGSSDASSSDAGSSDASSSDAGSSDAGSSDAGSSDAGDPPSSGEPDDGDAAFDSGGYMSESQVGAFLSRANPGGGDFGDGSDSLSVGQIGAVLSRANPGGGDFGDGSDTLSVGQIGAVLSRANPGGGDFGDGSDTLSLSQIGTVLSGLRRPTTALGLGSSAINMTATRSTY